MKQRCLSWNTNTLLTLWVCVWTALWVRMTAEPWGGKAASLREEASFHPSVGTKQLSLQILWTGKVDLRNRKDVGLPRLRQCPAPERTRQYQVQGRAGQHKLPPLPLLKYFSSWLGKLTKSARVLFDLGKLTNFAQVIFVLGKLTNSAQVLFKSGNDQVRISSLEGPGPLRSVYIRLWYIGKKLTMPQDSYCWFSTFELEMHFTGLKMASENLIWTRGMEVFLRW